MIGRCPVCGAPMEGYSCSYCGYKSESAPQIDINSAQPQVIVQNIINNSNTMNRPAFVQLASPKSKWVAFFLCFFLGFFGVHHFYVGNAKRGLLYLFTIGICGIGWIIDLILIPIGSFKDNMGLPLKQ